MQRVSLSSNSNSNLVVNNAIIANSIEVSKLNVTNDVYINDSLFIPVGSILTYAGNSVAPSGWFICDGSEVSQESYPRLYAVIGSTYGTPDNSANFVLPNLADRILMGKSGSTSVGQSGGNNSITLSTNQLPSHSHTGTSDLSGSHSHTGTTDANGSHTHTGSTNNNGNHSHTVNDPGHSHTQWTNQDDFNGGGGNPPSFMGDAGTLRTWNNIYSSTTGISVNDNGSHSHSFTTASSGNHAHTFTTVSANSHAHTFTTDSTGSGNSIDIRNKFVVINYIIRY